MFPPSKALACQHLPRSRSPLPLPPPSHLHLLLHSRSTPNSKASHAQGCLQHPWPGAPGGLRACRRCGPQNGQRGLHRGSGVCPGHRRWAAREEKGRCSRQQWGQEHPGDSLKAEHSHPAKRRDPESRAPPSFCAKLAGKPELCAESWVQGSANFFCKGLESKYFQFHEPYSLRLTPFCWCSTKTARE